QINKRLVITVFYPVGHEDLVLSGALPVEYLSDVLRIDVPADRTAVLLDREGRVIARSQKPEDSVGKLASPELRQRIVAAREGTMTLRSRADAGSFVAFAHLDNGWATAIEISPAVLAGPMHEWERQVLLNLVAFVLLAVIGAAAAGEWIAPSIAQLAKAARTIGGAQPRPPLPTRPPPPPP